MLLWWGGGERKEGTNGMEVVVEEKGVKSRGEDETQNENIKGEGARDKHEHCITIYAASQCTEASKNLKLTSVS